MADVIVRQGVNKKLQERLGYSEPTIRKALRGMENPARVDPVRQSKVDP